jgi:hypothetical protein
MKIILQLLIEYNRLSCDGIAVMIKNPIDIEIIFNQGKEVRTTLDYSLIRIGYV